MQGLSSLEARNLILSVGTHKSGRVLLPIEVAELMQKAINAGMELRELATTLQFEGPSMIRRFTRLLALPTSVQLLIGWGADVSTISFTTASEIARLDSTKDQLAIANLALEHQLTTSEVKQIVQIKQRSRKTIEESLKAVLRQRPVIERRHVIIGSILSAKLKEHLKAMSQLDRNDLLRRTLERHQKGIPHFSAKLGKENFVIVGGDDLRALLVTLPGGFETTITRYLKSELGIKE